MPQFFAVSDLARQFNCPPRDISDLLYGRFIPDDECPVIGGRRLIPEKFVAVIAAKLADRRRRRILAFKDLRSRAKPRSVSTRVAALALGPRRWPGRLVTTLAAELAIVPRAVPAGDSGLAAVQKILANALAQIDKL